MLVTGPLLTDDEDMQASPLPLAESTTIVLPIFITSQISFDPKLFPSETTYLSYPTPSHLFRVTEKVNDHKV